MSWKLLKQSTSVDLPIGPFLSSTDGFTAMTALTITQPDIRLKKNGGAWAQKNAAQTLTHEENGNYEVTYDTTDSNTLGHLKVYIAKATALPVWDDFMVVPANVYDALINGTDKLQVHTDEITADLIQDVTIHDTAVTLLQANLAQQASLVIVDSVVDDIAARTPSALTALGNMKAELVAIDGLTASAANLARSTNAIGLGAVSAGATTTSIPTSSLSPAAAVIDQFKGRIIVFDNTTTTVNLRGQFSPIESNTAAGVFTVTALTNAPVAGDTFTIT